MDTLDKALQLLRRGKLDEGIAILQELLPTHPDDPTILYNLGMAYSDLGQIDKAISMLEKTVRLHGDVQDHTALGVAYARDRQWSNAAEQFRVALNETPDDVFALKNLGAVLAQMNQHDEAIETLERAYNQHPEQTDIAYNIGRAYEAKEDNETADEWYQKALAVQGPEEIRERVKDARRRVAEQKLKRAGFRIDAMTYCLAALQKFSKMSIDEVRAITTDIGMTGQRGFDINDPSKRYTVKSMEGDFSGLQLVSYMYVGVKMWNPDLDVGIDLEEEYQKAKVLFEGEPGRAGESRGEPGRAGESRGEPGRAGESRGEPGRAGESRGEPGRAGESRGEPGRAGESRGEPGRAGESRPMTIDDLQQSYRVDAAVVDLVMQVERETGKHIEFQLDEMQQLPVIVKIARERMDYHVIRLQPGLTRTLSHLIANKVISVQRMMMADPQDRVVPTSDASNIDLAMQDFADEILIVPEHLREQAAEVWLKGIVTQVTNLPVQVRIEQWIAEHLPSIRAEQESYLSDEIAMTVQAASEKIRAKVIPAIFEISNAMTYAYVKAIGELLARDFTEPYKAYPEIVKKGKELNGLIEGINEGYTGDRQAVNAWAQSLGIAQWFWWTGLDDMPDSYIEDAK